MLLCKHSVPYIWCQNQWKPPSVHDWQVDCLQNSLQMDGCFLNSFTSAVFHLHCSSRTHVHPGSIGRGGWHWLQREPALRRPGLPWTAGDLAKAGWTTHSQQVAHAWHRHSEQRRPTHHPWVYELERIYMFDVIVHICLHFDVPLTVRPVGGGRGGVYLWGPKPLRQDRVSCQHHRHWTG